MQDPNQFSSQELQPRKRFSRRTIFFGACAVIAIIVYVIVNGQSFDSVFIRLGNVISPLIIGCGIAYICNPFLKFYEYVVFRKLGRNGLRRMLSLLLTFLTLIGIIAVVLALIIPELIESITNLVVNYEFYLNQLLGFVQSVIDKTNLDMDISSIEKVEDTIIQMFGTMEAATSKLITVLQNVSQKVGLLDNLLTFVSNLFSTFLDIVLGIFIAFYILTSKEKRKAQIKKFCAAYLNEKQNAKCLEVYTLVNRTFGAFIKGVLLDALAVGVVTFLLLSLCRVSEYNMLIAVICAVTNIIPVFGPFIGAIPSALIVLISNPEKLLLFLILVVIIQQIDGNILCPIIQGNNTGISSLAVLVSITVMGGFFGLAGMIIGVPVFAVIIELVKRSIEARLTKQGKTTDTTDYYPSNAVGNAEEEVYYERAHWKYIYDHSTIKRYIDKVVAARKERQEQAAVPAAPSDESTEASDADKPEPPAEA